MLKNKPGTKQIINEWRRVLNEGLYDQDPELLEEIFTKASRQSVKNKLSIGLMILSSLAGNYSTAQGEVTGVPKDQAAGIVALSDMIKDENSSGINLEGHEVIKFFKKNEGTIKTITEKLQSPNIKEFSEKEASVFKELVEKNQTIIKELKEIVHLLENLKNKSEDIFETIEYMENLTIILIQIAKLKGQGSDELEKAKNKGDKEIKGLIEVINSYIDGYFK